MAQAGSSPGLPDPTAHVLPCAFGGGSALEMPTMGQDSGPLCPPCSSSGYWLGELWTESKGTVLSCAVQTLGFALLMDAGP